MTNNKETKYVYNIKNIKNLINSTNYTQSEN